MATLNIQDYGAVPNDGLDDTAAIQAAFDAAAEGDTIYIPAGVYDVTSPDPSVAGAEALVLDRDLHPGTLKIVGDGEASHIRLMGDHSDNHALWEVKVRDGFDSLTIRNLKLDGNKNAQSAVGGGIVLNIWLPNAGHVNNVFLDHLWIVDGNQNNLSVRYANGVRGYYLTITGAGSDHGIAYNGNEDSGSLRGEFKHCYLADNYLYGVDIAKGHCLVEDTVSENNGYGAKTAYPHTSATFRRVRFSNNTYFGYQRNPTASTVGTHSVVFEDVIAENNGWSGIRFGKDTNYTVGTIVANANNSTGSGGGNIDIADNSVVNADTVYTCNAVQDAGINSTTSGSASISTLIHSGNAAGLYAGTSNLTVTTEQEGSCSGVLPDVPTASEVGATAGNNILDIRSYGAAIDGTTDDTAAIQAALDDAQPGDTVYIPTGTTRVFPASGSSGTAILVNENHSGVTLRGDGETSIIKMLGGVDTSAHSFVIRLDLNNIGKLTDVTIRDLVVDGNKAENPDYSVLGIDGYPGGTGHNILIEDVVAQNCSESGVTMYGGYCHINRVTARDNGRHGFGPRPTSTNATGEYDVLLTNVLAENNGGLGIDHNDGSAMVDGFWLENNGQGGAKVPLNSKESWWYNGSFINNPSMGFRWNGSDYTQQDFRPMRIHLDNVVSKDNTGSGYWLAGDAEYYIGTILADNNNINDEQQGNYDLFHEADLIADTIISYNAANGPGIFASSDDSSTIQNYYHYGNAGGATGGDQLSNLTIVNQTQDTSASRSLTVPAKSEVGAWSATSSTPVGSEDPDAVRLVFQTTDDLLGDYSFYTNGGVVPVDTDSGDTVYDDGADGVVSYGQDIYDIEYGTYVTLDVMDANVEAVLDGVTYTGTRTITYNEETSPPPSPPPEEPVEEPHPNVEWSDDVILGTGISFITGNGGKLTTIGTAESLDDVSLESDGWAEFDDVRFNAHNDVILNLENKRIKAKIQHVTGDVIAEFEIVAITGDSKVDIQMENLKPNEYYRVEFDGILAKTDSGRAQEQTDVTGTVEFRNVHIPK